MVMVLYAKLQLANLCGNSMVSLHKKQLCQITRST